MSSTSNAYDGLRVVAGHPTTSWIDDDPESPTYGSQTEHPLFSELKQIVPDVNDARHLYQAKMNDVSDFVTIDEKTILSRATEIRNRTGINVWSPTEFISDLTPRST